MPERAGKPLDGQRILLVEDEYLIAMEVEEVLRDLGADIVGPFSRLEQALGALAHEPVHGAVLDVRLDHQTIDDLALSLVSQGVPVLLTTGYEQDQLPPALRDPPRLKKPYSYRDLRTMIEQSHSRRQ
jgi:response regulator RpfG family c-di-GMP phosphodiesterase